VGQRTDLVSLCELLIVSHEDTKTPRSLETQNPISTIRFIMRSACESYRSYQRSIVAVLKSR
jgi:hypothetical protein